MRLHRSALFAGLLALGVAACGDDVQVVEPTPPPPPALNVTLSPNSASVLVGGTADYAVGISGGAAGVAATWTCTTAAAGVATVAQTATGCRATGVAAGNTSITVTVTKGDQSANAGAGITVTPVANEPARLSIGSVTQANVTANINAVQGQLDVTLNLTRNDETPTKVELLLGGMVVAEQNLVNQAPAQGGAEAQALEPIQLSFNTNRYNANGSVWHVNGPQVLSARVTVAGVGTPRAANNTITLNLTNPDQLLITAANSQLPTNSALSAGGQIWYGGPASGNVGYTVLPLMYSGRSVSVLNIPLATTVNGGVLAAGCAQPANVTAPAAFTFASACATQSGPVAPGAPAAAQATDGNAIAFGAAVPPSVVAAPVFVGTHPFPVNVDKVAAAGGSLRIATMAAATGVLNRENWVPASYPYAQGYVAPVDAGVGLPANGGVTYVVRSGSAAGAVVESGQTTAAGLTDTVDNLSYFLQAVVVDRLGNSLTLATTVAGGQNVANAAANSHTLATFGKDSGAPTISRGNLQANAITTAQASLQAGAGNFEVQGVDVISGFSAPAVGEAISHALVSVLGTANSAVLTTAHVAGGAGTISTTPFATANAGSWVTQTQSLYALYAQTPTSISTNGNNIAVPAGAAYYIYQARIRDKAGNLSPIQTWQVYRNAGSSPLITGLVIGGLMNGGGTATFPAVTQDVVEVAQGSFDLRYPGVGQLVYERPSPTAATLFDDAIAIPNQFNLVASNFIRSLQGVNVGPAPFAPAGAQVKPDQITARAYNGFAVSRTLAQVSHADAAAGAADGTNGASAWVSAGILPAQVQNGVNYTSLAAPVAIQNFQVVSYQTGAAVSGVVTATVRVRVSGVSGTFVNPFPNGLVLVERTAAGNVAVAGGATGDAFLRPVAATFAAQFNAPFPTADNGVVRDFDWTFTVSAPTGANRNFHVVGLNAGFDGLATREIQLNFAANVAANTAPTFTF